MVYRTAIITALLATLVGCAAMPSVRDELPPIENSRASDWAKIPAISYRKADENVVVRQLNALPEDVAAQPLQLELMSGATVGDLVYTLGAQGIPIVIHDGQQASVVAAADDGASVRLRDKTLHVVRFDGAMGDYMQLLTATMDIAVNYRNGVVILSPMARYVVSVPQHEELMKALSDAIPKMGADNVLGDLNAGTLMYSATPGDHELIIDYIERATKNSALVTMQVALIDVRLDRERSSGFNWDEFTANLGSMVQVAQDAATGSMVGVSGSGLTGQILNENVDLKAVLGFLSRYGTTKTDQNITLTALTGSEVSMRSGENTPYVGNFGISMNSNNSMGSASVENIETGLSMRLKPLYNTSSDLVSTLIELEVSSIKGYVDLNAGEQFGTITQPIESVLEFESVIRMHAGETVILGGIQFDQVDNAYTSVSGMEDYKVGSNRHLIERHAMFLMMRPTITLFGDFDDKQSGSSKPGKGFERSTHTSSVLPPEVVSCAMPAHRPVGTNGTEADAVYGVFFDYGTAVVGNQARDALRKLAYEISAAGDQVALVGLSDGRGSLAGNRMIAQLRADNVQKQLIELGLPAASILSVSGGEICDPNIAYDSNRARRVEIHRFAKARGE